MRRLNSVDNMFLKQESPDQPQHTIKAVVLDPAAAQQPLGFDAIRAVIPALLERVEPLRWQLLFPPLGMGRPWWIERSRIDLDYHLRRATVAPPGGDHELCAVIDDIVSVGLDRARPAWQLWYVDGLAGGRIALVLKIHHAVADGLASVRLMEAIFSSDPGEPLPAARGTLVDEQRPGTLKWLGMLAAHNAATIMRFPNVLLRSLRTIGMIRRRNREGRPGFAEAFAAPATRFNERIRTERRFAYVTCDMGAIRRIRSAFGVSINDVFLAICSGAIRSYLELHGELPAESLTAVVPVAIRPPGVEVDWGNQVSTWFVSIATDVADPVERIKCLAANTSVARAIHAERDLWLFGDWMDYWPLFWFWGRGLPLLGAVLKRRPTYSMTVSNVPGPKNRLYLAGAPIEQFISVGPIIYPYGLNLTGWSHMDSMVIAMQVSRDRVPDIWALADRIPLALEELGALAAARSAG